jgi:ribose 5-phosphate isomerase B
MIYISSDHRGLNLKDYLVKELVSKGFEVEDLGPKSLDPEDDYPDFATLVAKKVLEDDQNKGIVICANGLGVSIAANKYNGIRAALSWNPQHAKSSRNDDDANILALPACYINNDQALDISTTWLTTPFSNEDRFIRRLNKIKEIENEN